MYVRVCASMHMCIIGRIGTINVSSTRMHVRTHRISMVDRVVGMLRGLQTIILLLLLLHLLISLHYSRSEVRNRALVKLIEADRQTDRQTD